MAEKYRIHIENSGEDYPCASDLSLLRGSPQAPAANAPRYGSGHYAYKVPQTSRPGARNLGRRR